MPDIETPPSPSTPPAPSSPTPGGETTDHASPPAGGVSESKGISRFMQDIEKPSAEPARKDAPITPEKPATPPTSKPPAPAKQGEASKSKAQPSIPRENFAKLEQELNEARKADREKASKLSEAERRLAEIESKAKQSEADAKRAHELEQRITQLQGELSQTAYERSDEFKAKYQEPFSRQWTGTLSLIKQLVVENDLGEKRAATEADFQKVFYSPISEQAAKAQEIFGANASLVLHKIARLEDMRDQANAAVEAHKTDYEKSVAEQETTAKTQQQEYERYHQASANELTEKYPQFFAADEKDPEASQALQTGYEFVDNAKVESPKLTIEERAAYSAVIRARAAAFPLLALKERRNAEKIAALEGELAKYRGSDPGDARHQDGAKPPGKAEERRKGVQGLITDF